MTKTGAKWTIGLGLLVIYLVVAAYLDPGNKSKGRTVAEYNPVQVCDDEFDKLDVHSNEHISHFDVKMREGCFGGFVYLPGAWHHWHAQPVTPNKDFWFAIWLRNENQPRGPFFPLTTPTFDNILMIRVQGHGTVRFYTNENVTAASAAQTPSNPPPYDGNVGAPTNLTIRDTDAHICDKPSNAYYANRGRTGPMPAGSGEQRDPFFLFDDNHQDNKITWANGFQGIVPVCFVVDTKGDVSDIKFVKPPPDFIQEHIRKRILGWRYKPGTVTTSYRDQNPQAIAVQMAFDFVFP